MDELSFKVIREENCKNNKHELIENICKWCLLTETQAYRKNKQDKENKHWGKHWKRKEKINEIKYLLKITLKVILIGIGHILSIPIFYIVSIILPFIMFKEVNVWLDETTDEILNI